MNDTRRKPRKKIRLIEAARILGESRTSVNNRIRRNELTTIQGPGKTSLSLVFETDVVEIAKRLGIL